MPIDFNLEQIFQVKAPVKRQHPTFSNNNMSVEEAENLLAKNVIVCGIVDIFDS